MHTEKSWKQKRASLPKVRTGCMTCKARRVKCDERRPSCLRCEKASFECHGYEDNPPPKRRGKPIEQIKEEVARMRSTTLLPRPSSACCASKSTAVLSLRPGPTVSTLKDRDVSYYDLFRHQLVRELSSWAPSDFWERIVLLESERDESVRESVLAIGALAQAIHFDAQPLPESARPNLLWHWCGEVIVNEHHREALRHHTNAVSLFRACTKSATPRSVIITSMLLVAFELLQGNVAMAERLLFSVITLLQGSSKFLQLGHNSHQPLPRRQTEEDLDEIEHILPCLSVLSGHSHFAISQRNLLGSLPSAAATSEIPDWRNPSPLSWLLSRWGRFYTRGMTFIDHGVSLQLQNVTLTLEQESELHIEQASFLEQLHEWRKVLRRYPNQRALRLSHIQWLKIYISISSLLDRTDLTWDNFLPEMEELNEYAADLLRDPKTKNRIGFTLCDGSGMIGAIGMVLAKARDHEVRMRAAALLKLVEAREGAWDPKTMLIGLSWLALMEEQVKTQIGYLLPQQRWYWAHGKWDLDNGVLQAEYFGVIPNEFGEMVSKTILLDKEPVDVCAELGCAKNHAVAW